VLVLEVGLVGAFMDRRSTADALEAAARFRGLAEATSEGLAICDGDVIVDVNSRLENLTGMSSGRLCSSKLRSLFHEESTAIQIGPYAVEVSLRGPNGEPVPCEAFARTVVCRNRARTVVTFNDLRERRRAEARIAHLVHHDTLTDLPNRAAFNEKLAFTLARASVTGEPFAVMCLDLDRFKEVNDVFGHPVGDGLLRQVSRRLFSAADSAFLARIGGDEFMLIAADGEQPSNASVLANRLVAAIADSIEVEGYQLRTTISVGIAIYPTDGSDMTTLLRNADAALYRAKCEGHNVVRFFDSDMAARLQEKRVLKQDLKSALASRDFILHYQPQARITGEITGFEALARWRHPERGMVPPDTFIPLMEENGLIVPIGEWILREACREAASWSRPLHVAVNLSPIQFRRNDLPQLVLSILLETGLSPCRLELEITEGVLIDDFSRALSILRNLKSLGVSIVMDDFGSGYSSLSYLQSFPFDKIKIDKAFISSLGHNSDSGTIVRAAIALARGLGLTVVAEGVETLEQHALLAAEKCDQIQGYLIGRPRMIEGYTDLTGGAAISKPRLALAG
jgi:diguanylate cyclase (GGDEF)-like protein